MTQRAVRFEIERSVEFRLTDQREAPSHMGKTVNISSGGVLIRTELNVGVGRKIELVMRVPVPAPDGVEVDLRLLGVTVRSGQGWVAAQIRKHQFLSRPN